MNTRTQISKNKFGKIKRAKIVRGKDSKDVNFININKKDTLYIPDEDLETKLLEINKEQKLLKRSSSSDIDSLQSRRYIWQKQEEYAKGEEKEENKIDLSKEIEPIENFLADCHLFDKNTKEFSGGKLFIDKSYTFKFFPEKHEEPLYFLPQSGYYNFPLLLISQCTNSKSFGPSKNCKEIILKDNRDFIFIFEFTSSHYEKFSNIIEKFALPSKNKNFFNSAISNKALNINKKNIKIYNLIEEFKRQGIDFNSNKQFKLLNNGNFKFCETYPKQLIVPFDMNDEELKRSAEFRTKNRVPTLTYRFQKNGCCIWRSSQPRGGFNGVNKYDILLMSKISNNQKLCVFDARPKLNAVANKFKGAGYEDISKYDKVNMELIFCGIANIHAVRKSYQKLLNTVSYNINDDSTQFLNIANSEWYDVIIKILSSSFQIYESITEKNNILIHCSDGWDRTSQLCSMSQILLDKYYRTIDGFICLIEKDWLSFGHQFRYRNGLYAPKDSPKVMNDNQFSPIFLQWLDCLYQLMDQNYTKFQFNFNLLSFLAEEIFAGKYGTFLFNNDKERQQYDEENRTVSIWNYIKENEELFINNIYNPNDSRPLVINYKKIKLWSEYFYRFEKGGNGYLEEYEDKSKRDKRIIEDFAKFIANNCSKQDINKIDYNCKVLIQKFMNK